MKINILEIYSLEIFPDLIIGKPKDGMYAKSLENIEKLLKLNYDTPPIFNLSDVQWININNEYGTWGHITGVKLSINEDDNNYDFSLIFNFYPEIEKLEDVIYRNINNIDWKNNAFIWDAGDL